MNRSDAAAVQRVTVAAYRIPTDSPQSDGTYSWDATTLVLVEVSAAGRSGLGYSYTAAAAAVLIEEHLAPAACGLSAFDVPRVWRAMHDAVRNIGRPGIAASAIAAVDCALWDLKARLLGISLVDLLGAVRDEVPVYGSGGFTSYDTERLTRQLGGWAEAGIGAVKMKVGRRPAQDLERVRAARSAIGPGVLLMIDANGGYGRRQALSLAADFAQHDVRWFEEPVSSDDLQGLRMIRLRTPPGMEVAAGEYGYDSYYFRRMLEAGAVDVLQADVTRCGGITGLLQAAALCSATHTPLSTHTAPALHLHAACAADAVRDVEYFHDHVRIESMLFDGLVEPRNGRLAPDRSTPGHGLTFRRQDAERYRVA